MSTSPHRFRRFAGGIGACVTLFFLTSLFASAAVPSQAGPDLAAKSAEALEPGAASTGAATTMTRWTAALSGTGVAAQPATETTTVATATGLAAVQPAAEATAAAPVLDPTSSTPPPTSTAPPIEPAEPDESEEPEEPKEPTRDCPARLPDGFKITDTSPTSASLQVSKAAFGCAHEVGLAFADNPLAILALVSRQIEGPLLLAKSDLSAPLIEELRRLQPELIVAAGIDERLTRRALAEFEVEHVEVGEESPDRVWIVDAEDAAPLAAIAQQVGVGVIAATGDLRALPRSAREAISGASEVEVLADLSEEAAWQLEVIRRGNELPGGGLLLFEPGDGSPGRRMVAVYGHPSTGALGVLGEQDPDETVERLRSIAEGYGADGSTVLPTFEIIATVASAGPGADGDYSSMTDLDALRPWIETAAANDVYVVLDLQPGRSDFLTQAKHHEEFLRLPHVGLALDPEWRLKPDEVHLTQIGTVDAAEINQVVEWLAGIVRDEALPQKLLIVHQFQHAMITDRKSIETPPELAVVIHMDGQGYLAAKHTTWNTLTGRADADRFYWGWKNFYDEDHPMATPEEVLGLSPKAVFVSFQ